MDSHAGEYKKFKFSTVAVAAAADKSKFKTPLMSPVPLPLCSIYIDPAINPPRLVSMRTFYHKAATVKYIFCVLRPTFFPSSESLYFLCVHAGSVLLSLSLSRTRVLPSASRFFVTHTSHTYLLQRHSA